MALEKTTCAPTIFVVFGATGDLFKKKIIPALFELYKDGLLPWQCKVVGFARRPFTDESFRLLIQDYVQDDEEKYERFIELVSYAQGNFDDLESYNKLVLSLGEIDKKWNTCSNKLFYLAVPPQNYESIFNNIYASGMTIPCGGKKGWTRILVEKPFGNDLKHALFLEKKLQEYFKEEQIFRIDHYLAKETMQNILAFRFSNPLFEAVWNKSHIAKVEVVLQETNDVATRGAFYDGVGALRDVGQNHALQMLALVLMQKPKAFSAKDIRIARTKVIESLGKPSQIFLGQYAGYTKEFNVPAESTTETFFSLKAKAHGIPVVISGGKALSESKAEIRVTFQTKKHQPANILTFYLQPKEGVAIRMEVKKPGLTYETAPADLSFMYKENGFLGGKDAYAKVLYDAMLGDQTLFPSSEEIMAGWKFVMYGLKKRSSADIHMYEKGSRLEDVIK